MLRAVAVACALLGVPGRATAQGGTAVPAVGAPAGLLAEVQRLRAELAQVNRDVEALKRGDRGLRDDARLRQRMADAESLARKLTDYERRLASFGGGATPVRPAAPLPSAVPGDGPAELSAKADILTDEAQRLVREADRMAHAADSVRGRELLRRRVGQLDRDPFAGFESSKRSLALSSPAARTTGSTPTPTTMQPRGSDNASGAGESSGGSKAASDAPAPPAPGGAVAAPTGSSGAPAGSPTLTPTTPSSPMPATGTSGGASDGAAVPSLVFRTLLDPTTISELRRIEAQGTAASRAEAFARASAALRARASALETQAAALRRLAQQK